MVTGAKDQERLRTSCPCYIDLSYFKQFLRLRFLSLHYHISGRKTLTHRNQFFHANTDHMHKELIEEVRGENTVEPFAYMPVLMYSLI